jgi:hypothetical protein
MLLNIKVMDSVLIAREHHRKGTTML